jgi:uncharacterized membrane protein YvbJ
MLFCSHCGKGSEKQDVFCRKCGSKISIKPTVNDKIQGTVSELEGLVDEAARGIKKELLEQVFEIEDGLKKGNISQDEFDLEAEEIRDRLHNFIEQ